MPGPSPKSAESRGDVPRYQPLVIVLVAACAGIVADRYWPLPVWVSWGIAGTALAGWLWLGRHGWKRSAPVVLLLAVAATGASWHHCQWFLFDEHDLGCYARTQTQPVCLEAVALESARVVPAPEPDPISTMPLGPRARVELALVAIRDGVRWRAARGRTRLEVYGDPPDVGAGDRLRVFGQLSSPPGAENPGEFDYAAYLRAGRLRSGVRAQYPECVSVVGVPASGSGRRWGLRRLIDRARCHGNRLLRQYLAPGRSALAAAVLLGAREGLDPEQTRAFMQTGTVHLLAISGLHVGILVGVILVLVLRAPIPRGRAMLGVAAFAVFYMLLTDARPPVVRATILVLVICGGLYMYRRPLSFNSLAAAGVVVVGLSPADLFHTGAQLSFLAVGGLMYFAPRWVYPARDQDPLERMIAQNRGWLPWMAWGFAKSVQRLILIGAMIWLVTMPLVMARFHLLTPIGVLLNTVLWVPMALALMSGFAAMVLGTLAGPLGQMMGSFCDTILWLIQSSVDFARALPGGHFWVPGPADWWLAGLYGGLGLLVAFPRIRPPRRWCLALLAAWSLVGFAPAWLRHQPARLDCTFLSVGHGCAVVLQLPSGQTMLYDAGQLGSGTSAARSIAGFLWSRGITHLDAVVLSHADLDHYNALPDLLERFSIGVIYVSPMMWEDPSPALTALQEAIRQRGVPVHEIWAGDWLRGGQGCRIEVLHPPRRGVLGGDNANSIVLDVQCLGHRVLLPGDLESPGLDDVLAEEPIDYDVLLVPHHGSSQSNPPGLAAWSTPEWVVVSGSRRWDSRPVEAAYRAAGSRVFHTAEHGAVRVTIDASGVKVGSFVSPPR